MVTSNDLMVVNAPVGSYSARWVTTQLKAVVNSTLSSLVQITTYVCGWFHKFLLALSQIILIDLYMEEHFRQMI
jgi:hypothetical protein